MPKNINLQQQTDEAHELIKHQRQPAYLLTQRQAVTRQNEHEPKQH